MQLARMLPFFDRRVIEIEVAYCDKTGLSEPGALIQGCGAPLTFLDRAQWGRLRYMINAARFMQERRFDVVHAWTHTANIYGRIPAIMARTPVIIGGMLGQRGAQGWAGIAYSATNWNCRHWIVNSSSIEPIVRANIRSAKPLNIHVLVNGIDCDRRPSAADIERYRSLKGNGRIVGIVGRLVPIKDHALFLETAARVARRIDDARFWIFGDGALRPHLENTARRLGLTERVAFFGERHDVDAALACMDICLLTSHTEGCPNVLLEAMQASVPIVSTACTCLDAIVQDGYNGCVIGTRCPDAMADAVCRILADEELRQTMGVRGSVMVRNTFEVSKVTRQFEATYLNCVREAALWNARLRDTIACCQTAASADYGNGRPQAP
jgi:glycosyltransferase involved in cell wall biosynthesis